MRMQNIFFCFILLLSGCAFEIDSAMERDEQADQAGTWIDYQKKGIPTALEMLAIEVVKTSGHPQQKGNLSAWMKEYDPPFAVVAADEKNAGGKDMVRRTMYRFEDETIVAYSYPEYIESAAIEENKANREKYAREVAIQAKERRLPLLPVMYESKYVYSPKFDGGCTVVVTEKNSKHKIIGSYTVNVCQDEK